MTTQRNDFDPKAYNPKFEWGFLAPKYWGTWIAVLLSSLVCFLPNSIRLALAKFMAKQAVKIKNKANRRARVNLEMCFPEQSLEQREETLYQSYVTSISFLMGFASLTLKSKTWLENHTSINGLSNLTDITDSGDNVILLVPHTWAIDIPCLLYTSPSPRDGHQSRMPSSA